LSDAAKEFIMEKGYSPEFGARPLKRTIERLIEDPLSEDILRGQYKGAEKVLVEFREGRLYFSAGPRKEAAGAVSSGAAE
jgi:ATP-dependent Clp protease ATP-binding subunit ClpC